MRLVLRSNGRLTAVLTDGTGQRYAVVETSHHGVSVAVTDGSGWSQTEVELAPGRWGAPAATLVTVARAVGPHDTETSWTRRTGERVTVRGTATFGPDGTASWTAETGGWAVVGRTVPGAFPDLAVTMGDARPTVTTTGPVRQPDGSVRTSTTIVSPNGVKSTKERTERPDGSVSESREQRDAQGNLVVRQDTDTKTYVDSDGHTVDRTTKTVTTPSPGGGTDTDTETTWKDRDSGTTTTVRTDVHRDVNGNVTSEQKSSYSTDGKNESETKVTQDETTGETTIETTSKGEDGTVYRHTTVLDRNGEAISDSSTAGAGEGSNAGGGGNGGDGGGDDGEGDGGGGDEGGGGDDGGGDDDGGGGGGDDGGMPPDDASESPRRPHGLAGSLLDRYGNAGEGEGEDRPSARDFVARGIADTARSLLTSGFGNGEGDGPGSVTVDLTTAHAHTAVDDWGDQNDPRILVAMVADLASTAQTLLATAARAQALTVPALRS
ncbi:hypothetical protein [Frankia sp. R43]|uniref:hypothetical protein n=1 Tax=Frankia sp. R43 TaxID=269536 RepID=UPI0006CA28E8|nr:hypothetical protein [Frankia sp. R43]